MANHPRPSLIAPRVLLGLLGVFVPAVVLTGAVVLALYEQDLRNEHALHVQAATDRVEFQTDLIRREMRSVESDLLYLANQADLSGFVAGQADGRRELEAEYVLFCRQRGVYDQIRYLDVGGRERLRVNYNDGQPAVVHETDLQPKVGRYYFTQALRLDRGEVFVSPFDLNVEHDQIERPLKPVIRFATPVFDRRGTKRGILILNYLGAALLSRLTEAAVGFTGTIWLLNHDGHYLRGPTAQDEWGFMLGHEIRFATYFGSEWAQVAATRQGQFRTERGLFTFRTVSPPVSRAADRRGAADADEATLIVVARIPVHVLEGRANGLLQRLLLLDGVVLFVVFILAWYLAVAAATRRAHERDLAESADRLRTLSLELLTAQENERRSISRDLHDALGQVVTSISLDLQRAGQAGDRERKDELIGRALRGASRLLEHIHEISTRLRPTLLDDLGLKDAVQSFLGDYEQRTGIATRTKLCFERTDLPPAVTENLYRLLQEALTNVSKHAKASEVFVGLQTAGDSAILTVRDDGIGLAEAAGDGTRLGILGMRERAELLGGVFTLKSEPGRGTEVQVTIPIPPA
jgi:signal transduction histidine kinase